MERKKRALLSVSDKTGIVALAEGLAALGFEVVSTGGTARLLRDSGIVVSDVSEITGFPEILDGRVKTLHPHVHAGILARRDVPAHLDAIGSLEIAAIDVVVVNLYPFEATVAKDDCTLEEAIEQIDIGGPSLLRAAAKNWEHVVVLSEPADYEGALEGLGGGAISRAERYRLATKAFSLTARYDGAISGYLSRRAPGSDEIASFPATLTVQAKLERSLRYGENPHQQAAFYRYGEERPSLAAAEVLQGKELSYNNYLDLDAALGMALELDGIGAVVIKHTNPCGVAVASTLRDAYALARACDPQSAFGGIVGLTAQVDAETAEILAETFLEAVVAPSFSAAAREVLARKKNLRLLAVGNERVQRTLELRRVQGGLLVQDADRPVGDEGEGRVVSARPPTPEERQALSFAWRVAKHVKSNAIVFAHADRTVGIGAGQMSRVDSVHLARHKAVDSLVGTVVASDAFFPFPDGVIAAAEAGATAVIQPGGSIRDEEVIAAANERDLAMVFTGTRHFRH